MRSTVSIKTFILILVIFFIGVSSLLYFFLYRPKINKVAKGARQVSQMREALKKLPKRPHGFGPNYDVPPGVRCVDCHLKPAPPN